VAAAEGFSDWLIMPGRVPHDEVEAYYSLIDIAPFPRKPLPVCEMVSPMKPLEALAMEKAVVVSSVRALTEMISDGNTGRVFEKGSLASLADVLQELIEQPDQRAELGRRGRAWVCAERTWNQVGQEFRKVMGAVLPGRAEPVGASAAGPASAPVAAPVAIAAVDKSPSLQTRRPSVGSSRQIDDPKPAWWDKIDIDLRGRCRYVDVTRWALSESALALREEYVARFDAEAVARRIPLANWARADICAQTVAEGNSLLDVGSGLGEFINLVARRATHGELTSVDVRDWDLWFDATGRLKRIKRDFFALDASCARDVVTCFEVIEHLPTERVAEAVRLLRSLARQRLYVSVPFMEGLPMHRGHRTRFDATNLGELFADAQLTVYGKGNGSEVRAWIMCEVDVTRAGPPGVL
jgi:SAM-dependent methyltransferase